MTAQERREKICSILEQAKGPVSASTLAAGLGVSRQIVVGDIALLRAGGYMVDATPRGYVRAGGGSGCRGLLVCCHTGEQQLREELYCVVDNGGVLEDVTVDNPLYGEITARLHIASRYDADMFAAQAQAEPESLLSRLTGGMHLHTVTCPDNETLERIRAALLQKGILQEK